MNNLQKFFKSWNVDIESCLNWHWEYFLQYKHARMCREVRKRIKNYIFKCVKDFNKWIYFLVFSYRQQKLLLLFLKIFLRNCTQLKKLVMTRRVHIVARLPKMVKTTPWEWDRVRYKSLCVVYVRLIFFFWHAYLWHF